MKLKSRIVKLEQRLRSRNRHVTGVVIVRKSESIEDAIARTNPPQGVGIVIVPEKSSSPG